MAEHDAAELSAAASEENSSQAQEDIASSNADNAETASTQQVSRSPVRLAVIAGLTVVVILTGLVGWLSYHAYQTHEVQQQRRQFLEVGRQAALNLTTIDFGEVDKDVSRILDSATGQFLDDFQKRAQPFIDVVRQAKSRSEGTVAEAGIESIDGNGAQVLVAVQVKTSVEGGAGSQPRGWRMRIDVQKVGSDIKVSDVQFVP